MKQLITLILLLSSFCFTHAQVLPNGDFEDWSTMELFNEPTDYNTTNPFTLLRSQVITTTLIDGAQAGDSAVHLETVLAPNGNIEVGQMGNVNYLTGKGGTRFSGQPDSISYRIRYKAQPNDSVFFSIVFFNSQGMPFAGSSYKLTGKSNGWVEQTDPLQFPVSSMPIGYILQFASSTTSDSAKAESFLDIDYIHLNSNEQIENADFEEWDVFEHEKPDHFEDIDLISIAFGGPVGVTKDTSAVSGDYSARIETKVVRIGAQVYNLGVLHTGDFANWYNPIDKAPLALDGIYKYIPAANTDFGVVAVIFVARPANVPPRRDTVFVPLNGAADWTKFEINFQSLNLPKPDSVSIIALSSNPIQPTPGSVLYLDDLKFVPVTSVEDRANENTVNIRLSPNPVVDRFAIDWVGEEKTAAVLEVYNQAGKCIKSIDRYTKNEAINIADFPSGYYSIRLIKSDIQKTFLVFKR